MKTKQEYIKCEICNGIGVNHYADNNPCGICDGDGVVLKEGIIENIPYPKKKLKPCPDFTCNLRLICKRPKSKFPYTNIWHGEDEETGIHFCNYIIHNANPED